MIARYRVEYSPKAYSELVEIYAYIAQDSVNHAVGMIERILKKIDGLDTFPHRHVVQDQSGRLDHPVRSLPVNPYIVFFRVVERDAVVRILRIRHGARRPLKRF